MKKSILLAGVACVLIATNASAGMREMIDHTKYYVGADYAFSKFDYKTIEKRCSQLWMDFGWAALAHVYNSRKRARMLNMLWEK